MAVLEERKATAFLVVVAFTAGIGSATAIYAVIHSLLLKPLPYAHGERFVWLLGGSLNDPFPVSSLNMNDVREYQQGMRSFDAFGCPKGICRALARSGSKCWTSAAACWATNTPILSA